MENKFLKEVGVFLKPMIYMMIHEDSYFDVHYSEEDIEEINERFSSSFKSLEEAWRYLVKSFGTVSNVFHEWVDTDIATMVFYLEKYDEYYKASVPYSSYDGYETDYVDLKRVFPKEKTITVYE